MKYENKEVIEYEKLKIKNIKQNLCSVKNVEESVSVG